MALRWKREKRPDDRRLPLRPRTGQEVEIVAELARELEQDNVLWLDLSNPTDRDRTAVGQTLELREAERSSLGDPGGEPRMEQQPGYLRVVTIAISDDEPDPDREQIFVDCLVGANWIVTADDTDIAALDDFRETAEGEGELGALDAPSFLATLLEWVITSYLRAFDEIEETLEEIDLEALSRPKPEPGSADPGSPGGTASRGPAQVVPDPTARSSLRSAIRSSSPSLPRHPRRGSASSPHASTPRSPARAMPGMGSPARSTS